MLESILNNLWDIALIVLGLGGFAVLIIIVHTLADFYCQCLTGKTLKEYTDALDKKGDHE